jgi:putative endonuclease
MIQVRTCPEPPKKPGLPSQIHGCDGIQSGGCLYGESALVSLHPLQIHPLRLLRRYHHQSPGRPKNHRISKDSNFAPKYNLHFLVYHEKLQDKWHAFAREKQLKNWHREWKLALIRKKNPMMRDLCKEIPGRGIAPDWTHVGARDGS